MKVSAILKGRTDSLGRKTIYIRSSDGQKRSFRALEYKVLPANFSKGKVVGLANSKQMNLKITSEILNTESGKVDSKGGFKEYVEKCFREWQFDRSKETLKSHKSELKKVLEYKPNLRLTDVDNTFLVGYKEHLYEKGNSRNTVWKSFKFLRTIMNKAIEDELIFKYPFKKGVMPIYRNPDNIKHVTLDQMEQIKKLNDRENISDEIKFVANWFLIGCNTGLRYADMNKFNSEKHIVDGRLVLYTSKKHKPISLPINRTVREHFEKVSYQPLKYSNQAYNRLLKDVQDEAGIDGLILSAHSSRHSFAVMCATRGVSQEVAAEWMGVTMKVISVYYKLFGDVLDKEHLKLA